MTTAIFDKYWWHVRDVSRLLTRRRALILAISLWLTWTFVEHIVIRVDRFRPAVVAELERATQLPVSVGKLDLALFPLPHLNVCNVQIGAGSFSATSGKITTYASLPALLGKKLVVRSIEVKDFRATLSTDPARLSAQVETLLSSLSQFETTGSLPVELAALDKIYANDAKIFFVGHDDPVARISAQVNDALSDAITVVLHTRLPQFGRKAVFRSDITVSMDGGDVSGVDGSASLRAVRLAEAIGLHRAPDAQLEADFDLSGANMSDLLLSVEGDVASKSTPSLQGPFSTTVSWRDGLFALQGMSWETNDSRVTAELTRSQDGETACAVPEISLSDTVFAAVLDLMPFKKFHLDSVDGSEFKAENIEIEVGPGGIPRVLQGNISFHGMVATLPNGDPVDTGIHGRLEAVDGVVHIHEIAGDGFALRGTIAPDPEERSVRIDLSGETELTRERVAALVGREEVVEATGSVSFERIAGTFVQGEGVPDDLVVEAVLVDGRAELSFAELEGLFDPISLEIKTDKDGINTTATGASEEFGDVSIRGRYSFGDHQWLGTAVFDVPHLLTPILTDKTRRYLSSALEQFGESRFQTKISLPYKEQPNLCVHTMRDGLPFVRADLAFVRDGKRFVLGPFQATGRLEVSELGPELVRGIEASGPGEISFRRDLAMNRYEAVIDLTECSVKLAEHVEKRPGDPLRVEVSGLARENSWNAERILIDCLGVQIPIMLTDEGVTVDLDIDASPLGGLMPEGGSAHGNFEMSLATRPFRLDMNFDNLGFAVTEEIAADHVNGHVSFRDGRLITDGVTMSGLRSDCTFVSELDGREWKGRLTGQKFDMNFVNMFWDSVKVFTEADDDESSLEDADDKARTEEIFEGSFALDLKSLFSGRCRLDDVRADVVWDKKGTHIRDLTMRAYTGTIEGLIQISPPTARKRYIELDLAFNGAEARVIDELFFDEPRDLFGIVTGDLDLRMPWGTTEPMINGADGSVHWTSQDGSFGKLGFATKLLTVLKSARLVSLKLPVFKDRGLTYEECSGTLSFDDGVMEIGELKLLSPSYSMEGAGLVDWTEDDMDVYVFVGMLESIGRLMEKVPLIRRIKRHTTDLVGVGLHGTGPPLDPEFGVVGDETAEDEEGTPIRDEASPAEALGTS